jgi:antitoxin (DNA-binding transcriptional repressor) of toxin-antitoxin stability system
METLKIGELKTNFSNVLKKIRAGKEIVICYGRKDEKIAVLMPYKKYRNKTPRPLGILEGKATMKIHPDFSVTDEELLST